MKTTHMTFKGERWARITGFRGLPRFLKLIKGKNRLFKMLDEFLEKSRGCTIASPSEVFI